MAIDPHNLPADSAALHQIVLQLLQVVEDKDRLLERVQRQLEQLLRQRYGPKRERIDENQLFLYAAQIVAASQSRAAAEATPTDSAGQETPVVKLPQEQPLFLPDTLVGILEVSDGTSLRRFYFAADPEQAKTQGKISPPELLQAVDAIYAAGAKLTGNRRVKP